MPRIVHELPNRLRLRFGPADARLERAAGAVRDLAGVAGVRLNPGARTLVVQYDGDPATRARVLADAANPPERAYPLIDVDGTEGAELALAGAAVIASLVLPRQAAGVVTVANIAGTVLSGVHAALTSGLKVEVLDALAVGLPTLRGRFATANFARFLVELANYIESTTVERSDALLRSLLHRKPDDVWVEGPGGQLIRTPFNDLKGGEHIAVGLGETVPVDGVVVSGDAYVDQSAVTGESLPIPRAPGGEVLAGSIVTDGRLVVRADRIGEATATGRITRYIQDALEQPAEIQSMSDALADKRVGITLASAAGVFALTRDWRRIESVFMVDYSCTVKLGTPIVLKTAMYNAAKNGCLVKSGQTIENLANIDTVIFDKTGTLTHNTLQVTDVVPLADGLTEEQAVAIVASLGEHTTHPIARAVVQLARTQKLAHVDHEEVNFIVGHGVEGVIDGDTIRFGSRHYLEDDEHVSFARQRKLVETFQAEGKSLLYVARNNRPLAVFALRDRLRNEAYDTVQRLRDIGIERCVMITGDHRAKALAFGEALGLDEVHYEQQPEDKAVIVARLKAEGRRIAYVGDGVNDGPALMTADVGIAMPRAADIARATADIILLDDKLESLVTVIDISQRAMKLVDSNFKVAVGANSAILAGAVTGVLPSIATAALHNGTTIGVLARSLLANRSHPSH
ncbi:heavy metal translocating P-type ATPase [Pseudochelatococcus contaminans]|uniref:P-type Zn(2+) transporter n=1 Tax=Pseudochelatococcus contaminans TaxID=1538103 RepID=A0A7W6EGP9_9HYPH|nr:heavy metal translocating P-type ATPase [Pseudochelatococcus contaminans]MBB3809598.1 heavy metal translocating P-type ATPase [Pseudochelatococcus contaminans]